MTQKPNKKARPAQPDAPRNPSWQATIRNNKGWLVAGTAAAVLGGTALFNRANTRRAEAETPPIGKFVEVDGTRLHYVDRGTGPVVVLLHGNGVLLQDFEVSGVLGLAAERHRVIAFDRPGFGYSDRPRSTIWTASEQARLIARALEQIGVGPAVVVGHSWGAIVAATMALDQPQAVAGLVLLSGCYYATLRPDIGPFSLPAVPLVGDLAAYTVAPVTGFLLWPGAVKASFAPAEVPEKFKGFPTAMAMRPSQVRATGADTAMMLPSVLALRGRFNEINVPVIVMAGDGDLITHIDEHAEKLVEEIDQAELRVVPGQGHLLHYNVPEQVVAAISDVAGRTRQAS